MAQHGAAGWAMGSVGPGMDDAGVGGNDVGFVGHVDPNTGSYLDGPATHENPYDHVGYAPNANPYGQQGHGHYAPQHQYSNMGFAVEGQPQYSHDIGSLGPTQVAGQSRGNEYQQQPGGPYANGQSVNFQHYHPQAMVGQYPEYTQQQQHITSNDFQRNSWPEPQPQHSPANPYAQGQQLYANNAPLLRVAAASPAQSPTPKHEQKQPAYPVDSTSFQPHIYGGTYQTPQSSEALHNYSAQVPQPATLVPGRSNGTPTPSPGPLVTTSHQMPWSSQGQAQRLGSAPIASAATRNIASPVPRLPTTDMTRTGSKLSMPTTNQTSNDATIVVPRVGRPGDGWKSVKGCPNLFIGTTTVRRQVVTNTPGVKPHVAGDNRNGTRLLPLLPHPLPCEILREKVRPLVEELKRVTESIDRIKQQIKDVPAGSQEHKKYTDDLKKLESQKSGLDNEKKKITGKAGVLKLGKSRVTGKSEATEYDSESLTESSDEDDPLELIVQEIMASDTRPADPAKGIQYDVVKIIRREANPDQGPASQGEKEDPWSKVIGRRVADFGKYVVDICAEARALREEKAKAAKSQSAQLQTAIDQKYDHIRAALETALEFGDDETLMNMGQHMKLMSGLTIVLQRQFAAKIYNTAIPRTILRFISEATLMDVDSMDKVKLTGVLQKHRDGLDDEGKKLAAQITKNAEERTAKNAAEKPVTSSQPKQRPLDSTKLSQVTPVQKITPSTTKSSTTGSKLQAPASAAVLESARKETKAYSGLVSARKVVNGAGKTAVGASPTKRPRDDDVDSRVAKKLAVEGNVSAAGTGRVTSGSLSNTTAPPNATTTSNNNGQLRPRPAGSTVLNKSRAAKPPAKKPEPQLSGSSTIGGLLAEIAKPVEKPKAPERVAKAPETPEEKARRLRKESRRGRTVTWKPDEELVQVRFFEHDSNEDEGRANNMIRDARDNRQEGQMMKQMLKIEKQKQEKDGFDGNDMKDDDEEEDDGNPSETDIRPWVSPRPFDMSHLDASQKEKNYVTRCGTREINSEQKKVMEDYENRELMSIYTTLSEIPDTPRSPSRTTSEPTYQPRPVPGLPVDAKTEEMIQRLRETKIYGLVVATQAALKRLGQPYKYNDPPVPGARMTQEERECRVLALLQSDRARNYVDPNPADPNKSIDPPESNDQRVQEAWSILQSVVDEMKEKDEERKRLGLPSPNQPPQGHTQQAEITQSQYAAYLAAYQAQGQLQGQAQVQAPQHAQGYSQPGNQLSEEQQAAILRQVQALQNPQVTQNVAAQQPNNNVASLLATLGHTSQPAQPTQTTTQDANTAAWQAWIQSQAHAYATQSQAQSHGQSYPAYSQQYDGASHEDANHSSNKQDYQSQGQYQRDNNERGNRKQFDRGTKDHKGINRALIGTKPCTFWAKGQCAKGDNCTFRHDPNDLK
ncbi:hypothetical protein F5B22DRAFT_643452 [Xylaria bambusicola]|uniref:uncharacterized protein n=1 Tax=Xylaria bambusicola TaxID=326684 RepID=UPI002008907B|nr:uncharacterized protein F5B22DRAFT_643452 [Xylaria bambusicola]KAI0521867.1 hypothetical protein F5B22DRAFT_643452 [Xylaria bambusicola]